MNETTTVEMEFQGVEEHIHVPAHRVERYEGRGWKVVDQSSTSADTTSPYAKAKKPALEALVAERNADRDEDDQIQVGGRGTVTDLRAALEADDAARGADATS